MVSILHVSIIFCHVLASKKLTAQFIKLQAENDGFFTGANFSAAKAVVPNLIWLVYPQTFLSFLDYPLTCMCR